MILGIDTSAPQGGLALHDPATGSARVVDLGAMGSHAERLVPAMSALLAEAGVDWNRIDLVAVGTGPGSFTGVRVGIAGALGLGAARSIQVVGVGSLDIMARACYDANSLGIGSYIIALADVRRGEVARAGYTVTPRGLEVTDPEALVATSDPGPEPTRGTWLAGEGAPLVWVERKDFERWVGAGSERALAAARLSAERRAAGRLDPARPRYARDADARPRRR